MAWMDGSPGVAIPVMDSNTLDEWVAGLVYPIPLAELVSVTLALTSLVHMQIGTSRE